MHAPLKSLALFDFDGTLYLGDSFTGFIFYALDKQHILINGLKIVPWIKGYFLNLYTAPAMRKRLFASMFNQKEVATIAQYGQDYAQNLSQQLNPILLAQLKQHQSLGHEVVLVSASLNIYLQPLCELLNIQLICSEPEIQNGKYTGQYYVDDCSSERKKSRILEQYNLDDYHAIYAYGNSYEDNEMLSLAQYPYMMGQTQTLPRL